jgi:cytochrome c biogenesis protein CcmG/thiol:disulfide interchange protein DsbE
MHWRLLLAAIVIVPLLWLLAYSFGRDPRYIPSPLMARTAPLFELPLFDGTVLALKDLRGKTVFITFWASWCPPCRAEARDLEAAWRTFKDQDVLFLGINIQDTEKDALAFLKEYAITFPNGRDLTGKISIDYGVWGIPEAFFVDGDGRITYKHVGSLGTNLLAIKVEEAKRRLISANEGKGSYQPIR